MARVRFLCPRCFEELAAVSRVTGEMLIPDLCYATETTICDRCHEVTREVIVICST